MAEVDDKSSLTTTSATAPTSDNNTVPIQHLVQYILDHYTFDNYIHKMNINQLNDDCLQLILAELASKTSLTELVQKAFVSTKWFLVVGQLLRTWKQTSLKLFESERSSLNYRQFVLNEVKLHQIDGRFALQDGESVAVVGQGQGQGQTTPGPAQLTWKDQDHLLLCRFSGISLEIITTALSVFFGEIVTNLVISTFDIDQVEVLAAFPKLETLTLIELPESRHIQTEMWTYLGENIPTLRHFHLFHAGGFEALNVQQMAPLLGRLESFTLDRYRHSNHLEVLRALTPTICQRLCLGKFPSYDSERAYHEIIKRAVPELTSALVQLEPQPAHRQRPPRRQLLALHLLQDADADDELAFQRLIQQLHANLQQRDQDRDQDPNQPIDINPQIRALVRLHAMGARPRPEGQLNMLDRNLLDVVADLMENRALRGVVVGEDEEEDEVERGIDDGIIEEIEERDAEVLNEPLEEPMAQAEGEMEPQQQVLPMGLEPVIEELQEGQAVQLDAEIDDDNDHPGWRWVRVRVIRHE